MTALMRQFPVIAVSDTFSPFALYIVGTNLIEDWVTFIIHNELHRCKLRCNKKGSFFIYSGTRVYLDTCVRVNTHGMVVPSAWNVWARVKKGFE